MGGFVDNFPNRWVGAVLRAMVYPLGRWDREPGDRLTHRVAHLLLAPSEARTRLTNGVYKSAAHGHPVGMMEQALPQVIAAEPLERRIVKAVKAGQVSGKTWEEKLEHARDSGVISETEAETLKQVHSMVLEIIAVDEFDSETLQLGQQAGQDVRQSNAA